MASEHPYDKFALVYDSIMDSPNGVGAKFYTEYYIFINKVFKKGGIKKAKILEIACGTGKLAEIFLKKGYNIEGLDLSKGMLDIARKKGLKCYNGNMANFRLDNKYDTVLCIFDSLNYLQKKTELQKCFNSVNRHLNPNGVFIFDMNSDFKINKIIPKFKTEYYKIGENELIWLNSHKKNTWISEMILFEKAKDDLYQKFYEKHIEKAYTLGAIKSLLAKADFEIIGIYSDFKFGKIKRNTRRWFFACRKSG